jgi:subtilisin family serine protease
MPAPPPSGAKVLVQNTVNGFQVAINTKATFYATVQDTADQRVTWSIDDASPAKGTIAQNGEYTAPATVPSPDKVRIRATSVANTSVSGFLEITIVIQGGIAGTINIPAGLLNNPGNAQTQVTSVEPAKVFTPDWNAPRVKGQFLIVGDSVSVVRTQSASVSLQRARVQAVGTGLLRVETPAGESDAAFAAKVASETGARVQPNYLYKTMNLPNDPRFGEQTYLTQIDAQGAWSVQTALSSDNLIAVLDTGANFGHPDLNGRLNNGTDFCPKITAQGACQGQDNDSTDIPTTRPSGGHGTHAAGIIAAKTNNNTGIAGISHGGKILVVKVFANSTESGVANDDFTSADSIALSNGIKYAADAGAKVISLSLGIPFAQKGAGNFDTVVKAQIDYAVGKGALIVAAAGNVSDGDFRVFFPASDDNVLAVGAVDGNNARTNYSAYLGKTDLIFAPGNNILSTYGDAYGNLSGTSFATPMVAAVAGLMVSQKPALTRVQLTQFLKETAKPLGNGLGVGLLQAGAALRKAQNPSAAAVSTTIYVYADPLKAGCAPNTSTTNNACYDGNSPQAGRSVVTFTSKEGAVNYSVTINRSGQPLQPGTYRIVACVNKNSNQTACDAGDLFGISASNIQYDGNTKPGNDVTLAPL